MKPTKLIAALALTALGTLVAGCGSSSPGSSPATVSPSGGSASTDQRVKITMVQHAKGGSFMNFVAAAAMDAARDYNVDLTIAGPAGFDADSQLKAVEDAYSAGAQGVVASIVGESMARPINTMIDEGKPFVQFNLNSPTINAPFVGEKTSTAWKDFATRVLDSAGGAQAKGTALLGYCAPGLPVLEARAKAVQAALAAAPGLTVKGPFDTKDDQTATLQAWEGLTQANSDASILMGMCSVDASGIGKINKKSGNKYVGAGSDFLAESVDLVKQGHVQFLLGQTPYLQGYLPVKMLADAIRSGIKLESGILPSGAETYAGSNVEQAYGLPAISLDDALRIQNDPEFARKNYAPLFVTGGQLEDWQSKLEN